MENIRNTELPPHILVVDDDTRIRNLLGQFLSDNGYIATIASDAQDARKKLAFFIFDLVILDVMMPGETGLELATSLRQNNFRTPIIMLTAMGDVDDRIKGFEAGADDYLPKPFEPRELLLRIQSILRRSVVAPLKKEVNFGNFCFDIENNTLYKSGNIVHLTTNETELLKIFAGNVGETISREELAQKLPDIANERSIDVQITRLRKKIEEDPSRAVYLQTIRGVGYMLRGA